MLYFQGYFSRTNRDYKTWISMINRTAKCEFLKKYFSKDFFIHQTFISMNTFSRSIWVSKPVFFLRIFFQNFFQMGFLQIFLKDQYGFFGGYYFWDQHSPSKPEFQEYFSGLLQTSNVDSLIIFPKDKLSLHEFILGSLYYQPYRLRV